MSSDFSKLPFSTKRRMKKVGIPKPSKRVPKIMADGRILHPTKGFLPQSKNRKGNHV